MSKRIAVYLSEEELKELLRWYTYAEHECSVYDLKLKPKLEEQLETFEET